MSGTTLQWNADEFERHLIEAAEIALTECAKLAANTAQDAMGRSTGGVSSSPGSPPNVQTNQLRASIKYVSPQNMGTRLMAYVGTAVPYGRYLEGPNAIIVRPKRVKKIPVPVNEAARKMLRRLGAYQSADQMGPPGSLRRFRLKLIVNKASKQALLVEQTPGGKEKKNGAVFVLKSSVRIAPRPWLKVSVEKALPTMRRMFVDVAAKELRTRAI